LSVIVPIKNPGAKWQDWLRALRSQTYQPAKVLVVDSASTDQSVQWAQQSGCDILHIEAKDFAHGATRQLALAQVAPFSDWVVFLTQDAILASEHTLENLLHAIQSQPQS
jgi:rhamnosyltransferase